MSAFAQAFRRAKDMTLISISEGSMMHTLADTPLTNVFSLLQRIRAGAQCMASSSGSTAIRYRASALFHFSFLAQMHSLLRQYCMSRRMR
jgi:hypothetical protein